jgi:hypothetical protein
MEDNFELEVERVLTRIKDMEPSSEEYRSAVEALRVLCEARAKKAPNHISPESVIAVAANLVNLLLVLNYERINVLTSRAFGFVRRN